MISPIIDCFDIFNIIFVLLWNTFFLEIFLKGCYFGGVPLLILFHLLLPDQLWSCSQVRQWRWKWLRIWRRRKWTLFLDVALYLEKYFFDNRVKISMQKTNLNYWSYRYNSVILRNKYPNRLPQCIVRGVTFANYYKATIGRKLSCLHAEGWEHLHLASWIVAALLVARGLQGTIQSADLYSSSLAWIQGIFNTTFSR